MQEEQKRSLRTRLRKLSGQAQSLELQLERGDKQLFITQLEAVIAAARSTLSFYAQVELLESDSESDKKLLARLIKKS